MIQNISIGKYRALQRASTANGYFTILALDHHDALRRVLNPSAPEHVTHEAMVAFKAQVIRVLAPEMSGVLLDPIYGAAQAIAGDYLASAGLLLELEKADYALQPLPLLTETLPHWSVSKIKRMGADGVKLFYYYNIADTDRAIQQDNLLMQVAAECQKYDIPFYAEPILYPLNDNTADHEAYYTRRVIAAAQRAEALGADVLKMEFPLPKKLWGNATAEQEACTALTNALTRPWVLLSAGVDFETFCHQVEVACRAGASGIIAGRAVWDEAAAIPNEQAREDWLQTTGRERLQRLAALVKTGNSWHERLVPEAVSTTWYQNYEGIPTK
jgi:tagatose 1,6-diphosphate aldolase